MRSRADGNQADIIEALRRIGCTVQTLTMVGQGCPDLLIGTKGRNLLLEVKDQRTPTRPSQMAWQSGWRGQVTTVRTVDEALAAIRGA